MKIDYLAYSIDEFYNLGILDAVTNGKSGTEKIKETLKNIIPQNGIDERIKKYEFGYKVGLTQVLFFTPIGDDIIISEESKKLILKYNLRG